MLEEPNPVHNRIISHDNERLNRKLVKVVRGKLIAKGRERGS